MTDLQNLLNQFSQSDLGTVGIKRLSTFARCLKVYEFDSKGQIIKIHRSASDLRGKYNIRIQPKNDPMMTDDGRIFSYMEEIPNFQQWFKKRSRKISRPLNQLSLDGEFIKRWDSLASIENELGIARPNIIRYLKQSLLNRYGKRRAVGGFVWEEPIDS